MMMKELISKALEVATKAHSGQTRWNGEPYIVHPIRVAASVSKDCRVAAYLHDVIEDTDLTLDDLRTEGFSKTDIKAIDHLTKRPDQSYKDYILRVKENWTALIVKLADLEDNLRDLKKGSMKDKYQLAHYILSGQ